MATQHFPNPQHCYIPVPLKDPWASSGALFGPNDSPLHRGSGDETGDNEAAPDELGSGPAMPTVDPTSFGAERSIRHPESDEFDTESELQDHDGIEVMQANDGRLGLTDVGDVPADDWAADTGPARTAEEQKRR